METKIKWNEGDGYITAAYEGSGSGSASISSDVNEGIDREQSINVETTDKSKSASILVQQEGLREVFTPADGDFILADGGTFNVLKGGNVSETYTRLTYVECTGEQYIDLGYTLKEDDVINVSYISTSQSSSDKTLFGAYDGNNAVWMSLYGNSAYIRFGSSTSTTVSNATSKYDATIKKGAYALGTSSGTLTYVAMTTQSLAIFALNSSGDVYNMASCRCMKFTITDGSGEVIIELFPCKRDSDGRIGMLDVVSGTFYASSSDVELIGGSEATITDGYELIDYVTFAKDRLYDLGIVKSTYTLDVLFKRSESSSTPYLFALVTSPHTASVTSYLSSGGSWRFGSSYTNASSNNMETHMAKLSNGRLVFDVTSKTFAKSTFTTPNTVLLGGSREASGNTYKSFQGRVYYFRISEGNTIILDWMPCKRLSDGVEGFWDCVTQSFISPL